MIILKDIIGLKKVNLREKILNIKYVMLLEL
nr:MAG TPA: hypothetical protein [Crassvirales sp.]